MRHLFILSMALVLTACGSSGGDSEESPKAVSESCKTLDTVGLWSSIPGDSLDSLEVFGDCTGRTALCDYKFEFDMPVNDRLRVRIKDSNPGPSCLPAGEFNCRFTSDTDRITIFCGSMVMGPYVR